MAAIEALVALAFVLIVAPTIVVIIGVHQEERRGTLARGNPPTVLARFARRVLGAHFCLLAEEPKVDALLTAGALAGHRQAGA